MWSPFCTSALRNRACLFDTKAKKCGCCLSHIRCECTRPLVYPPSLTDPCYHTCTETKQSLSSFAAWRLEGARSSGCFGVGTVAWCDAFWAPTKTKGRFLVGLPYFTSRCFPDVFMSVAGDRLCSGCLRNSKQCMWGGGPQFPHSAVDTNSVDTW